ncbi:hypothetical protein J7M00_00835, partial [bacterium]|nr:hypothetical protein [bacterium]
KGFASAKNVDCEIGIFRSDKSFLEGGLGESLFFKRGFPQKRSASLRLDLQPSVCDGVAPILVAQILPV